MPIVQRVTKAIKDTSEVRSHDHEAAARVAVATMFNWMSDPSEAAIESAVVISHEEATKCRRIWAAMLAEMQKEAGF